MRNPLMALRHQSQAPRLFLKDRAAALRKTAAKVLRRPIATTETPASADAAQPDPILATIEESRRLFDARSAALELPPIPGRAGREEVDQAREAFYRHRDTVLLQTVPTTGQGCAVLAGYVRSHYASDRFVIEENEHGDANFRVLDLIARSHASGSIVAREEPDPVLTPIAASYAVEKALAELDAEITREGMTPERFARESRLNEEMVSTRRAAWTTPPTTQAGRWALIEYARFQVGLHTHPGGTIDASEFLIPEILGAVSGLVDALDGATPSPTPDPHVAMLPALQQAFAWDRACRPIEAEAMGNSPNGLACLAVLTHCWNVARRIEALPPPKTPAGLGILALALSVYCEGDIGEALNDGLDHERYPEEKRLAVAIRAMMSVAGVEPLPGWTGFGDEPDRSERWEAMEAHHAPGSLPAWALAGMSGPDTQAVASGA